MEALPKVCEKCAYVKPAKVHKCPRCGWEPRRPDKVTHADGQLVKLEQKYESDTTVLAIAAQKSGMWQHYSQTPDLDKLLDQELTLTVNVGMGATDPEARFQKFMQATGAYGQISMQGPPDLNLPEVRKELYGLAGFKDSARFFTQVDPRVVQAQKMMQQAEGTAKQIVDQHRERIQRRERQLDEREHQLESQQMEAQHEFDGKMQEAMLDFQLQDRQQQMDFAQQVREHGQKMALERQQASHKASLEVFQARVKAANERFLAVAKAKALTEAAKHAPPKGNGSGEGRVH